MYDGREVTKRKQSRRFVVGGSCMTSFGVCRMYLSPPFLRKSVILRSSWARNTSTTQRLGPFLSKKISLHAPRSAIAIRGDIVGILLTTGRRDYAANVIIRIERTRVRCARVCFDNGQTSNDHVECRTAERFDNTRARKRRRLEERVVRSFVLRLENA